MDRHTLRNMVVSAMMAALALTLPIAFHAVGLGSKFLPMLLPLLLNGFLVSWRWAALTGTAIPLASGLLTGMPPLYPPMVLAVSCEGAILGGVAAAIYRLTRPRIWPALIPAVVSGRVSALALAWLLARFLDLPPGLSSIAMLIQGLPGVALQLALAPLVVRALQKRRGRLFTDEQQTETPTFQ